MRQQPAYAASSVLDSLIQRHNIHGQGIAPHRNLVACPSSASVLGSSSAAFSPTPRVAADEPPSLATLVSRAVACRLSLSHSSTPSPPPTVLPGPTPCPLPTVLRRLNHVHSSTTHITTALASPITLEPVFVISCCCAAHYTLTTSSQLPHSFNISLRH